MPTPSDDVSTTGGGGGNGGQGVDANGKTQFVFVDNGKDNSTGNEGDGDDSSTLMIVGLVVALLLMCCLLLCLLVRSRRKQKKGEALARGSAYGSHRAKGASTRSSRPQSRRRSMALHKPHNNNPLQLAPNGGNGGNGIYGTMDVGGGMYNGAAADAAGGEYMNVDNSGDGGGDAAQGNYLSDFAPSPHRNPSFYAGLTPAASSAATFDSNQYRALTRTDSQTSFQTSSEYGISRGNQVGLHAYASLNNALQSSDGSMPPQGAHYSALENAASVAPPKPARDYGNVSDVGTESADVYSTMELTKNAMSGSSAAPGPPGPPGYQAIDLSGANATTLPSVGGPFPRKPHKKSSRKRSSKGEPSHYITPNL